jgi:DNA-binding transcriptional LysR family regulator
MGSVDLALIYDYPAAPRTLAPELTAVTLAQQPWQLVMPAGWPHAPGPSAPALSDLADHAWVVGLGAGHGHRALAVVCAAAGFTPRISATTTNRDIVLGMVSAELGIGVLPSVPWPANGEVSLRPFVSAGATRRTVAVHVREETDVMVLAAVRTLRAVAHPGSLPSSVPDSVPDTVPDTLPGSHPAGGR